MKRLFYLLIFLSTVAYTQDEVDSLRRNLNLFRQDTTLVKNYLAIGGLFKFNNPDSVLVYSGKAFLLANKLNFFQGKFQALANRTFHLALLREDSAAIAAGFSLVRLAEETKSQTRLARAYLALGSAYIYIEDFAKALYFNHLALKLEQDDLHRFTIYQHIAQCYLGMNNPDSALYFGSAALEGFHEIDTTGLPYTLYLMGNIHFQKGSYGQALRYYNEALTHKAFTGANFFTKDFADFHIGIGKLSLKLGRYDTAISHAHIALQSVSSTGLANEKMQALKLLTDGFESLGKLDSAYAYLILSNRLKDELLDANKIRQVQIISFNDNLRRQEAEVTQERKRIKNIIVFLLVVLIFVGVIMVITIRNNQNRKKAYELLRKQKQEIESQKLITENTLSDLKATQAQLVQSEKMASLGELTAGIAHEIENPLNFVNNFSDVSNELIDEMNGELDKGDIEGAKALASDVKHNLEKIIHHGKRADVIVKGMLQHSRNSSGIKEPTDINALVAEYSRLAYHGLRAKDKSFNAAMNTDYDQTIGTIRVIPQDIGRVILNLINNAFYAVTEKEKQQANNFEPTVSVSTRKVDNKILISVRDNGNGIPQKVLDKIFQPFFTTKPAGQGTGLGLSLSYDFVKAHGGDISVHTKEGEGSEFTIRLMIS